MIRERWLGGRTTRTFTLQWHLTQRCPFHCRHCYDRSLRDELTADEAMSVLSDLQSFGRRHRVQCRMSLSGGDPLHYPHFEALYRAAAEADIPVAILGNPIAAALIRELLAIQAPTTYQVSLEGLSDYNDFIRGPGHYEQTFEFLRDSRRLGLRTNVMLTLARDNMDQVLPLGEALRGLTERFTFNRLSQVGEGSGIALPGQTEYAAFLQEYLAARKRNPILGVKENLFNIIRDRHRRPLFPGCTGKGCGGAFNFVALLPDGEVHACRKFPSRIGNIRSERLENIYASPLAQRYREGSTACKNCRIRKACRGCPAVVFGQGLDPFTARDPHCSIST